MNTKLIASITVFSIGILVFAQISQGQQARGASSHEELPAVQQEAVPTSVPDSIAPDYSPSGQPTLAIPQSVLEAPHPDDFSSLRVPQTPLVDPYPPAAVAPLPATVLPCSICRKAACCCPVEVDVVLVDPDCRCSYDICLSLPSCCAGEVPDVSWRNGILGRKIATLCWASCNKRVKVVIPVFGGPRVWEQG